VWKAKTVPLTFGLLSPGKGIEHRLNALPSILEEFPEVVHIGLGATHPNELRHSGFKPTEYETPAGRPDGAGRPSRQAR
jgi:hypothetical protein